MSNTKRPNAARKETRKTKAAADAELERGLRVEINGEAYEVRVGDMTPALTRELRRHTGGGFFELLATTTVPDVDTIATLVWLARRIRGEDVTLDQVDSEVSYAAMVADDFDVSEARGEVDPGPEA